MSFGWSAGDIALAAKYCYKIYDAFADDHATKEFRQFKSEFRQIIECLDKLREINALDFADAKTIFGATLKDCEKFLRKHKHLLREVSATPGDNFRLTRTASTVATRLGWVFQTTLWPVYCEEAERLRAQLDSVVAVTTLRVTTATMKKTQGIEKNSEETTQAVKSLTANVNLLLKRLGPTIDGQLIRFDQNYVDQFEPISGLRSSIAGDPLLRPDSPLQQVRSQNILQEVRNFSQRLESLMMRDLAGHQNQQSDTVESVQPILRFLDTARNIANIALDDAGLPPAPSPSQPQTQIMPMADHHGGSTETLHQATEDWSMLNDWVKWHMLHGNTANLTRPTAPSTAGASSVASRLSVDDFWSPPPSAPTTPITLPSNPSITDFGSEFNLASPVTDHARTLKCSRRVTVEFPDAGKRKPWYPPIKGNLEVLLDPSGQVRSVRTTRHDGKYFIEHKPWSDSKTPSANPLIPWIDNKHVVAWGHARLHFKGIQRVSIKDAQHNEFGRGQKLRPVYIFDDKEDFQTVQNVLLGKQVVASLDVVRIATQSKEDLCHSETLRVMEDEGHNMHLLFFAHNLVSKSSSSPSQFVEWSMDDFDVIEKPGPGKKIITLPFKPIDAPSRRSTATSITSFASFGSKSSQSSKKIDESDPSFLKRRIKALRIEFYEEQDCKAFVEAWTPKPTMFTTPVF